MADLYQFWYHVTLVDIFQVKNYTNSIVFVDEKSISTLRNNKPTFCLLMTEVPNESAESLKFSTVENFSFFFLEILKVLLKYSK